MTIIDVLSFVATWMMVAPFVLIALPVAGAAVFLAFSRDAR